MTWWSTWVECASKLNRLHPGFGRTCLPATLHAATRGFERLATDLRAALNEPGIAGLLSMVGKGVDAGTGEHRRQVGSIESELAGGESIAACGRDMSERVGPRKLSEPQTIHPLIRAGDRRSSRGIHDHLSNPAPSDPPPSGGEEDAVRGPAMPLTAEPWWRMRDSNPRSSP